MRPAKIAIVLICAVIPVAAAHAGGGPENILLVVNSNSESSKTIANHYIELRRIPPSNVLYIDWKGSLEIGSAARLRDEVLMPILKTLDERHLTGQIDYVVYSSDFPWRVELVTLFPDHKFPPPLDPYASTTGVTYLLSFMVSKNPNLVDMSVNWYVPGPMEPNVSQCTQLATVPSRAFRSRYMWDPQGKKTDDSNKGQRYLLSTMLGVTQGRGNSIEEVLTYLRRSAGVDGTRPEGTIYFMWNRDIRSATRDKCFDTVAAQINAIGVRAKVQQGKIPDGAKDVIGMMVGASDFDLLKSGIVIQPGAICEHLTSAGGILTKQDFQTPLSAFLRAGASGASGTVAEPRAIQAKFPLPSLQLHYARGCSLAESFYQSITGPYQILIVGDPLCQPWAAPPKVSVKGITPDQAIKGMLSITPTAVAAPGKSIGSFDIFIDGHLVAHSSTSNNTLDIDTTKMPDGYHELRVIATNADPIETQGRAIVPFTIHNHNAQLDLKAASRRANLADSIRLSVRQSGAKSITVRQNRRSVGSVQGEGGEIVVPASTLGRGPVTLQAFSEGPVRSVSPPLRVTVE